MKSIEVESVTVHYPYADEKLRAMTLAEIAKMIRLYWPAVNYAAKPYLDAMSQLNTMNDKFYADDAQTVVLYFLSNASGFRGEPARAIKKELKRRCGIK